LRDIKTTKGIVIKDIIVEVTITLAMLSTTLFSEYIDPTKYVKIALGIADWIRSTPAATPLKFKYLIKPNPIKGPITILTKLKIEAFNQETTFNFVRAIPRDMRTKKIVAYVNKKVVLTTKPGTSQLKYKTKTAAIIP
tara:strand:+ start:681 stop:1094 length:414 start_codon:yes stop_codon:yes gene_type:complete